MKQHVLVTHDESTFYANDFQRYSWVENNESYCLPKSQGRSIMVSEFQCPCHGTMRGEVNGRVLSGRKIFYPGSQYQGYWTSQHMKEQLEDEAIPLFKALHPDCIAVFLLGQSSNHNAFAPSAPVAKRMNMNAIEIKNDDAGQGLFSDQSFYVEREYNYCEQQKVYFLLQLHFIRHYSNIQYKGGEKKKYFVGIRGILADRKLFLNEQERYAMVRYCNNVAVESRRCCAVHLLEVQPDFLQQKSILAEVIENNGFMFELYPKYHCECNWIERYWGAAKREARRECDYSFQSLDRNIHNFLDSVCPPDEQPLIIRKFFNKSFAYIRAYAQGKDVKETFALVEQFSKLHKSHRKLRTNQ
ncbi:hypothetical protein BD560DRAFT_364011 [Blakeslea trispora]|nr:hypothetical protein BD560DRAFT_364011 [Blakeslea trispora]